ncbi:MAG: DsbA family protein [Alphaproteobacteria bacterium]|nr:DsbA family protein [Alphaproteobacteria bacterium]
MNFERIIKTISGLIAGVVVFFMAGGVYLSSKGFVFQDDGSIVLVAPAAAQDETAYTPPSIPDNIVLPTEHSEGKADAPVTLYEYSSFGCSHCADFHLGVLPELKKEFVDTGLLRVVFVPFPLDKNSMSAALVAECVPEDKYFEFINLLFKKQRDWELSRDPEKVIKQYATLNGLPAEDADKCLHNDDNAREILSNRQNGIAQLGIRGTPTFIISYNGHFEQVVNDYSLDAFKDLIVSKLPKKDN